MRKMTIVATLLRSILVFNAIPAATAQDTTPGKNGDKAASKNEGKGSDATAPVILLVPPIFAVNASLADGCWLGFLMGRIIVAMCSRLLVRSTFPAHGSGQTLRGAPSTIVSSSGRKRH